MSGLFSGSGSSRYPAETDAMIYCDGCSLWPLGGAVGQTVFSQTGELLDAFGEVDAVEAGCETSSHSVKNINDQSFITSLLCSKACSQTAS